MSWSAETASRMKSKLPACFCHLVGVAGDDDFVGAEAEGVFLLAGRGGEDDGVGAESVRELDAHVAQSAEADDADLLALGDAPVAHGRVGGDAGTEQGRGPARSRFEGRAGRSARRRRCSRSSRRR